MNNSKLKVKDHIKKQPKNIGFFFVDRKVVQNPNLSVEAKGYYAMIEAEAIDIHEVPESILDEFVKIGYVSEVR